MPLTTDPRDPRLTHGTDSAPAPQAGVYLVLSEEERAKGFVRPYRHEATRSWLFAKSPPIVPGVRYPCSAAIVPWSEA